MLCPGTGDVQDLESDAQVLGLPALGLSDGDVVATVASPTKSSAGQVTSVSAARQPSMSAPQETQLVTLGSTVSFARAQGSMSTSAHRGLVNVYVPVHSDSPCPRASYTTRS